MKMSFRFVFTVTLFVVCVTMPSSTLVRTSVISLEYVNLAIGELEPVEEENPYIRLASSPMDVSIRLPECKKGCYLISAGKCKCTSGTLDPTDFNDYYDDAQNTTTVSSVENPHTQITTSPASLSSESGNNEDIENTSWSVAASSSISYNEAIIDNSQSTSLNVGISVALINPKVVCLSCITLFVTK